VLNPLISKGPDTAPASSNLCKVVTASADTNAQVSVLSTDSTLQKADQINLNQTLIPKTLAERPCGRPHWDELLANADFIAFVDDVCDAARLPTEVTSKPCQQRILTTWFDANVGTNERAVEIIKEVMARKEDGFQPRSLSYFAGQIEKEMAGS